MLLHVIEAAVPIDPAYYIYGEQWSAEDVRNATLLVRNIGDWNSAECA
jgi:hypothetical protein